MSAATLFSFRVPWLTLLLVCTALMAYLALVANPRRLSVARPFRRLERIAIVLALVPLIGGLALVFAAKRRDFNDIQERLRSNRILDLAHLRSQKQLESILPFIESEAERKFVAGQIYTQLAAPGRAVPQNVGALSRLMVSDSAIDESPDLPTLRKRLDDSRGKRPTPSRLSLLSPGQIRAVKPSLVVRTPEAFQTDFAIWMAVVLVSFCVVHLVWTLIRFTGDQLILPPLIVLCGVGLILMTSLRDPLRDTELFVPFAQGIVGGCVVLLIASTIDYQRRFARLTFVPLALSLGLSIALLTFGSGPGTSDAKVNLGPVQPVEAMRLCLIFFFAGYFAKRWQFLRELRETRPQFAALTKYVSVPKLDHVLPIVSCVGLSLVFFFLQRDLGPALLVACLFMALYGIARGRFLLVLSGIAAVITGIVIGVSLGFPKTVVDRVQMFVSPWDNVARGGDQLAASLWALASGGILGAGVGLGGPADVPAAHTDMILSAVGEEMGLAGLIAVFACWGMLLYRGRKIAQSASSPYTFFLAFGCVLATAFQVLLISGGVLGIMPLSGVVSPFLSFGRSAMLANFGLVGILAAVSTGNSSAVSPAAQFQPGARALSRLLVILFVVVMCRVGYVQAWKGDDVAAAGVLVKQQDGVRRFQYNPRLLTVAAGLGRGSILDRNGIPLASSNVNEILDHRAEYQRLGIEPDRELRQASRYYPFGAATFHLLGDIRTHRNWTASNTTYVERDFEARLRGFDATGPAEKTAADLVSEPAPGFHDYRPLVPLLRHRYDPEYPAVKRILEQDRNIRLTIDAPFTVRVTDILRRRLQAAGKDRGAVVVIDVESGGVLASVSLPDPRDSSPDSSPDSDEAAEGELLDRARFGLYPPGSAFKLVTAAAALRADPDNADRVYNCQRLPDGRVGAIVRGGTVRDDVTDTHPHGAISMKAAIGQSCNAYFAQLAVDVGAAGLFDTARRLGINVAAPDTVARLERMLPQAGYGQGEVLVTPTQMARVAATIANKGRIPDVHLVDQSSTSREDAVPLLGTAACDAIAVAMRFAVTDGTGRNAMRSTVPIAGKTGTAELQGAPSHAWFTGFAPYGVPTERHIAFAVLVEHGQYGGSVAAPIAAEVVSAAKELGLLR